MSDDAPKSGLAALAGTLADAAVDADDVGFAFVVVVGKSSAGPQLELSISARLSERLTAEAEILLWEFARRLDATRKAGEEVLSRGGPSKVVREVTRAPEGYAPKAKA